MSSAVSPLSLSLILLSRKRESALRTWSCVARKKRRMRTRWPWLNSFSAMKWLSSSMVCRKAVMCGSNVESMEVIDEMT